MHTFVYACSFIFVVVVSLIHDFFFVRPFDAFSTCWEMWACWWLVVLVLLWITFFVLVETYWQVMLLLLISGLVWWSMSSLFLMMHLLKSERYLKAGGRLGKLFPVFHLQGECLFMCKQVLVWLCADCPVVMLYFMFDGTYVYFFFFNV